MPTASPPLWPRELQRIARDRPLDDTAKEALWGLCHRAISSYARLHASRLGSVDSEEVMDLAAEKSLDLLQRIDTSQWIPEQDTPVQVRAFLSTIARNGVVDLLRGKGRLFRPVDEASWEHRMGADHNTPELDHRRREFIDTVSACSSALPEEWQSAWWLRILFEWPSKRIARHPDVPMNPAHLDVVLGRCRARVRECMRKKGIDLTELPPGTFASLWEHWKHGAQQLHEREAQDGR